MNLLENISFMELLGVLILALVPTIILTAVVLISDSKSKEPAHLMILCFFSGFFTISLSLLLGRIVLPILELFKGFFIDLKMYSIFRIVILAFIEELSKFIVLYSFMSHNKEFDDFYDGFVYSALISLSFAGMETFLYVFNESTYHDMTSLAVLRNSSALPLHLVCGIVMGYFVATERFSRTKKRKIERLSLSLLIPITIHTFYNIFFSITMINLRTKSYALLIIILFLLLIYIIGYVFFKVIKRLNYYYDNEYTYPDNYKYLLTKKEFVNKEIITESKEASLEEIIYSEDFDPLKKD